MEKEIRVPVLPESVKEAVIANWRKQAGDSVSRDEVLAEIETDKIVLEVVAPQAGRLEKILKNTGETVVSEEVIGQFLVLSSDAILSQEKVVPLPIDEKVASPSVRRLMHERGIQASQIVETGNNRIRKEDILKVVKMPQIDPNAEHPQGSDRIKDMGERSEQRIPMSRIRLRIAERLLEAQHTAAILTTFNEINMTEVIKLRTSYKEQFEKKHQVRLGFMSFFILAICQSLKRFPIMNASLDKQDIIYHDYYDIAVAVASNRGLVVPVIRHADQLSIAELEKQIAQFAEKAKSGNLTVEDMAGGTFTISNGGVFGSLLSTPILNPPQSAILGMHKIQDRPVAVKGTVQICPMMYVALSYDHRLIDGADAVQFLVAVKEYVEDPERLLLSL